MSNENDPYLETAQIPDYVTYEKMAKTAVKAVLGILVSKLSEKEAREFTRRLPDYLSYETLRGHQQGKTPASPSDAVTILANKLEVEKKQAKELMLKILSVAKNEEKAEVSKVAADLDAEWREVFQTA